MRPPNNLDGDPLCVGLRPCRQRVGLKIDSQRTGAEEAARHSAAQRWHQQEHPKLLERQAADEHRRPKLRAGLTLVPVMRMPSR